MLPWLGTLAARIGRHTWLKGVGTTVGMTVFFVAYFALLRHPVFPVTVVPTTWIDDLIPFHPLWLPAYLSLWVYVSLAPAVLAERREVWRFAAEAAALSAVGLLIFLIWPTTLAPFATADPLHPSIAFLKEVDAGGNACPSLHVAFAVFTAGWFYRILRNVGAGAGAQLGNLLWAGAIIYSTLATKQHVLLDVIAGAALGLLPALLRGFPGRASAVNDVGKAFG